MDAMRSTGLGPHVSDDSSPSGNSQTNGDTPHMVPARHSENFGRLDRRRIEPRARPELKIEVVSRKIKTFSNGTERTMLMSLPRVRWMERG